jgi:hypothetical protein
MRAMTDDRASFAASLLAPYQGHEAAVAGLILGSISRGIADEHSDVDLNVIWREVPVSWIEDTVPLGPFGAVRETWTQYSEGGGLEQYRLDGRKIDVGHSTIASKRRLIDEVTVRCNPSPAGLLQVGGLLDGQVVFDTGEATALRQSIPPYPADLRTKVLSANEWLTPMASIRASLARGDLLAYYDMVVTNLRRCLYQLAAVNGIYLGFVPDAKWSAWYLDRMPQCPEDHRRLLEAALGPASERAITPLEEFMTATVRITATS